MAQKVTLFLGVVSLFVLATNLLAYLFFISPQHFTAKSTVCRTARFAWVMYIAAYILSLLRLPFAILPYVIKFTSFFILGPQIQQKWNNYGFQLLRTCGDLANLFITVALIDHILSWPITNGFGLCLILISYAEATRVISEKGQMLFSAIWQSIPHRIITQVLIEYSHNSFNRQNWFAKFAGRYVDYYALSDDKRIAIILNSIKNLTASDSDTAQKLMYIQNLQIVPQHINLRAGNVRNVATGEVYIHARWTNDPWLLVGLILRRTPWMFDPRYLQRPFYYRTQSNRLATLFVFQHAFYTPPFAWYQFGHEIKVARYDLFYRLCRWCGNNIEAPVNQDGTYKFDPLICRVRERLNSKNVTPNNAPLWTDQEVINDITSKLSHQEVPSAPDIASRYTYPVKYVQEVLLPQILCETMKVKWLNV